MVKKLFLLVFGALFLFFLSEPVIQDVNWGAVKGIGLPSITYQGGYIVVFVIVGIVIMIVGTILVWFLRGFFRVNEEERAVVEWAWGGYWLTAAPGLNWRPPVFSRIRDFLQVWEREIPIFTEGGLWIDLVDGSIRPRGGKLLVRIIDPLSYDDPPKPIYAIEDWVSAIKTLAETQTSSYLRPLTIEQALQEGRAGFDLAHQINRKRLELQREVKRLKQEAYDATTDEETRAKEDEAEWTSRMEKDLLAAMREIRKTKQDWGIEVTQIFIPDYDLSQEVLDARNSVQAEERRARAEEFTLQRRVLESAGVLGKMRQVLVEEYGYSDEEADSRAKELWEYLRGTETGSILDIRGGGGILDAFVSQLVRDKMKGTKASS